ncbi:MAG: hypothetical protein QOH74_1734 [Gaiellales bacterium]|jgi:ferredoxin-NADP reductase|nr:hypothetical protein [Gaiellales bacterium]
MARAAIPGRLSWELAEVVELIDETPRVRTIVMLCRGWPGHLPGQHVDVRLTAEDGYQAQRSYSIASAPEDGHLMLTVEELQDGEVSPYLTRVVEPGDRLDLRGPIGLYFMWTVATGGPLLLVAGGSGVVPMRAILRHHVANESSVPVRLLYSARAPGEVIFRDELARLDSSDAIDIWFTYTRQADPGWHGFRRRIDHEILQEVAWPPDQRPLVYVCGPSGFVETAASALVDLGHAPELIRTERFGPTG